MDISRISRLQKWRLGGIYSPFEKLAIIEPLGHTGLDIPEKSGIACTTPMVRKLAAREVSELLRLLTPGTAYSCQNFQQTKFKSTKKLL
jgi:hypothetical protein